MSIIIAIISAVMKICTLYFVCELINVCMVNIYASRLDKAIEYTRKGKSTWFILADFALVSIGAIITGIVLVYLICCNIDIWMDYLRGWLL